MKKNQLPKKKETVSLPAGRRWPRLAVMALCVFLAGGATWAVMELWIWNQLPRHLAGKWVVTDPPDQEGATFDFFRNGTMIGRVNLQGQEGIIHARVRLEGNDLHLTTRNPHTSEEETRRQRIVTLNAQQLILEDDQGRRFRMERAE